MGFLLAFLAIFHIHDIVEDGVEGGGEEVQTTCNINVVIVEDWVQGGGEEVKPTCIIKCCHL